MRNRLLKIALIGKTNAGKSTLINSFVGEKISIINKKINTTQDLILGIKNIGETQIIFYDTPGSNFLKTTNIFQKKLKINLWEAIESVDLMLYIVDVLKFNLTEIQSDILKISEVNKKTILVFNKIDLIENDKVLAFIDELRIMSSIDAFFNISAKYDRGIDNLSKFLVSKSYEEKWIYKNDEISNKDDIYITNECTRNALLEFLHQEIPYNLSIENISFKYLKNGDLKIKQSIVLNNPRYKAIILGKKGETIKRIREKSQEEIKNILNCKVHLYLHANLKNEK